MFKKYYDEKLKRLRDCLESLGVLKHRALFEGYSLSIDNFVFGMLVNRECFLRACDDCQPWLLRHKPPMLILNRKGRELRLNYYLIEGHLWDDPQQLLYLCRLSLNAVREEQISQAMDPAIKDLPNFTARMARHLLHVGINSLKQLEEYGACEVWLKLARHGKKPTLQTLYAIEGAILRKHRDVLPEETKKELRTWYEQIGSQYQDGEA